MAFAVDRQERAAIRKAAKALRVPVSRFIRAAVVSQALEHNSGPSKPVDAPSESVVSS